MKIKISRKLNSKMSQVLSKDTDFVHGMYMCVCIRVIDFYKAREGFFF